MPEFRAAKITKPQFIAMERPKCSVRVLHIGQRAQEPVRSGLEKSEKVIASTISPSTV